MLAQLSVQRGAADAEAGGDPLADRAVPDPLGGSCAVVALSFAGHPGSPRACFGLRAPASG
jgi:hypothetical protein